MDNPRPDPLWQVTAVLTSFFIIMALVATRKLDWIRWRWLTVAGAITYPLYLIHQDIGSTIISYLRGDVPPVVLAVVTYVAMVTLAWLIHRWVERPIAPLLRAKLIAAVDGVRQSGRPATPATSRHGSPHQTVRSTCALGRGNPRLAPRERPARNGYETRRG